MITLGNINMNTQLDLKQLLKKGKIEDELGLERAMILDRKLRLLAKEDASYSEDRKSLRAIIKTYEKENWNRNSIITDDKIKESDTAELIAEQERQFIERRKEIIKEKLAKYGLSQQDLGTLLGHGKSYMSELINGITPLSNRDIIILHRLFRIKLDYLIPTIITQKDRVKIKASLVKINKPNIKLTKKDLEKSFALPL